MSPMYKETYKEILVGTSAPFSFKKKKLLMWLGKQDVEGDIPTTKAHNKA
jgi:hypothetical protein